MHIFIKKINTNVTRARKADESVVRIEENSLSYLDKLSFSAVNKQLTENKRNKLHSSGIQGTSYGKRAAHCKILQWQVMNKKMNSNSMEHVQKQHFSFN